MSVDTAVLSMLKLYFLYVSVHIQKKLEIRLNSFGVFTNLGKL